MSFWQGFEKGAMKEVATIALLHGKEILVGKRNDNGKFTFPGGHLEKGEQPVEGAVRELYEEAGVKLKPEELTHLQSEDVKGGDGVMRRIHAYKAEVGGKLKTTTKHDPDDEIDGDWHWVPAKLPKEISKNLHVPYKQNVLLRNLKDEVKIAFVRTLKKTKLINKKTLDRLKQELPQQYAQNYDKIHSEKKQEKRARK